MIKQNCTTDTCSCWKADYNPLTASLYRHAFWLSEAWVFSLRVRIRALEIISWFIEIARKYRNNYETKTTSAATKIILPQKKGSYPKEIITLFLQFCKISPNCLFQVCSPNKWIEYFEYNWVVCICRNIPKCIILQEICAFRTCISIE